jgi:hypothetical protein
MAHLGEVTVRVTVGLEVVVEVALLEVTPSASTPTTEKV